MHCRKNVTPFESKNKTVWSSRKLRYIGHGLQSVTKTEVRQLNKKKLQHIKPHDCLTTDMTCDYIQRNNKRKEKQTTCHKCLSKETSSPYDTFRLAAQRNKRQKQPAHKLLVRKETK